MKKQILAITTFITALTTQSLAQPGLRPKLVVGIVVDQMRWDYLYRYADRYTQGGFKRLMQDGFSCENTLINYIPTITAPGHASIYTGTTPTMHGIAGNDWIDQSSTRKWYCTEDTTVMGLESERAGMMSPRNMLANTVSDELRLATNFRTKTIGIAIKDRGAILPAGHTATAAYWYDGATSKFISSNYYMESLPNWVKSFNDRNVHDSLMMLDWHTLYPIESYTQSIADNNRFEGVSKDEQEPIFPHRTSLAVVRNDKKAIRNTPYGNTITRLMAEACIDAEKMGQSNETDFLALSFSSTDYIGHQYAPNAIEVEDTYLRLDRELELFLNYLDKKVGKGNYTVFLTADHGAAHNAEYLQSIKIPAGSIYIKEVNASLNQYLLQTFGDSTLVSSLMNYQVFFNEKVIADRQLDRASIRASVKKWLEQQLGVAYVIDLENIHLSTAPTEIMERTKLGYHRNRSGNMQIILQPGWYSGYYSTGTTHGSWNPYDAHIPLLWYGWGIKKGRTSRTTYITDIAPTLAALLHIQAPNACIGHAITEVVDNIKQ
jgi:predicted AlkP superfamily pyrophosphatase or phosphodiesterase